MTHPPSEDFAAVAAAELARNHSPTQRIAAWQAVIEHAEQGLQGLSSDASLVACGPGCGTCCIVNVNILEPEALAIRDYVTETFPPTALKQLAARLEQLDLATACLDDEERIMIRRPCAFLDEQLMCSIHPVRPLLCRSITSTDPRQCREALAMVALGESPQIICHLEHKQLFEDAFLGLARALGERGLDNNQHRLAGLLARRLLEEGL